MAQMTQSTMQLVLLVIALATHVSMTSGNTNEGCGDAVTFEEGFGGYKNASDTPNYWERTESYMGRQGYSLTTEFQSTADRYAILESRGIKPKENVSCNLQFWYYAGLSVDLRVVASPVRNLTAFPQTILNQTRVVESGWVKMTTRFITLSRRHRVSFTFSDPFSFSTTRSAVDDIQMCCTPFCLLPVIRNGVAQGLPSPFSGRFSEYKISCNHGYVLTNDTYDRICRDPSGFTAPPTCEVFCRLPVISNGVAQGLSSAFNGSFSEYNITCDQGYVLTNNTYDRFCRDPSGFTAPPTCEAFCPLPAIHNGQPRGLGSSHREIHIVSSAGHVYKYKYKQYVVLCNHGYAVFNKDYNRTCQHPSGFTAPPSCTAITCKDPATPRNGSKNIQGLSYNSHVNFTCDEGFNLIGSPKATCTGQDKWSSAAPTCAPQSCRAPNAPARGSFRNSEQLERYAGQLYQYTDVVTWACSDGSLLHGSNTSQCLANGTWSTYPPICKETSFGVGVECGGFELHLRRFPATFGDANKDCRLGGLKLIRFTQHEQLTNSTCYKKVTRTVLDEGSGVMWIKYRDHRKEARMNLATERIEYNSPGTGTMASYICIFFLRKAQTQTESTTTPTSNKTPVKKSNSTTLIAGGVGGAAVILIVCVAVFVSRNKSEKLPPYVPTSAAGNDDKFSSWMSKLRDPKASSTATDSNAQDEKKTRPANVYTEVPEIGGSSPLEGPALISTFFENEQEFNAALECSGGAKGHDEIGRHASASTIHSMTSVSEELYDDVQGLDGDRQQSGWQGLSPGNDKNARKKNSASQHASDDDGHYDTYDTAT
ncbi:uncharacterized protein LOC135821340 [Sycon ciliatum]|uniref:uncharacterized protein LOC135821340 n=1 Tax=Sycon ciliatum TaxID=27933 RepID=UPI0031F62FCA